MHQLINEPTRITETSKTLIDIIITNKPENYLKSVIIHIGMSDHSLVYTCRKLSVPKSKHKVVVTRCLKKYNSHEFNQDLKCNFENFDFDTSNPNQMWESWKNIFNVILEKHARTRIRKGRNTRDDKSLQHVAATEFCRRDRILSLQHVAQNQTGLILCEMLQRQNSVAATKF